MKDYPFLSQALSQTIEIFRKDRKLTKSALAEFSWLERRYLSEIEACRKRPTLNAIYFICEALQVSPIDFLLKLEDERHKLTKTDLKNIDC